MLHTGRVVALLWLLVAVLALILVQMRNWFGAWSVLVSGAVVFAVTWWLPATVQAGFGYAVTWFLLFAGPREVLSLYAARRGRRGRRGVRGSDADQLARLTHLPAGLWVAALPRRHGRAGRRRGLVGRLGNPPNGLSDVQSVLARTRSPG